jgi:aryl-alcohol dehydrogenase-like predicted oxidoreductase
MRRVTLGKSGLETSCIGFGCASLGSRVSAKEGLLALEEAFDEGVTWYDLAPLYGGGRAEEIIAPFLKRHRAEAQICTKVGLAPPAPGGLKNVFLPIARKAVNRFPELRNILRRSGAQGARAVPLTPEILQGSLEASLRRLGTDYVDLYALHDVAAEDVAREPLVRVLEDILASGKARAIAVASHAAAALRAVGFGSPYSVVQVPLPPPGVPETVIGRAHDAGFGCISHSVFGVDGALAAMRRRIASSPGLRDELLRLASVANPEQALAHLLLQRAIACNPDGVVLVSMFSRSSREQNIAVASRPLGRDCSSLLDQLAA